MRRTTLDGYAEARRLFASVFEGTAAGGFTAGGYQHDHDEELGMYWYPANNDVRPRMGGDARVVVRLIKDLRDWHRPEF